MGCSQSSVGPSDSHYVYQDRSHLLKPVMKKEVRLLDSEWLKTWFRNRRPGDAPLKQCDKLPEDAFINVDRLSAEGRQRLKIVSISYCWLSEGHPDPDSYHVETVVQMMDSFRRSTYENTHGSYGFVDEWHGGEKSDWRDAGFCFGCGEPDDVGPAIFWDYFSVPSAKASEDMSIWAAHLTTIKWMLSYLPPDQPKKPAYTDEKGVEHKSKVRAGHGESGWTFYEKRAAEFCTKPGDLLAVTAEVRDVLVGQKKRVAAGKKVSHGSNRSAGVSHGLKSDSEKKQIKTRKRSNHLKKVSASTKKQGGKKETEAGHFHHLHETKELERHQKHDVSAHDYSHAGSYLQLVFDTLEADREIPMPPDAFAKELETKHFYDIANAAESRAMIIRNYGQMFKCFVADATHLDFGGLNFESHEARHLLDLIGKHCKVGVLKEIDLHTNEVAFSLGEIASALSKHRLHKLDLSGNLSVTGNLTDLHIQSEHLRCLNLTHTAVKGDIKYISSWKGLHELNIVGTDIGGGINSLQEMKLTVLGCSDSKIQGSFSDLKTPSNISHLTTLLLDDTETAGLLKDLQALKHLKVLHLSGAGVEGNFKDITPLEHLEDLVLHETSVTGALKDISVHVSSTHELKHLERLDISGTDIVGDIKQLAHDADMSKVRFTMPIKHLNVMGTKIENADEGSLLRLFGGQLDVKESHFPNKK